MGFGQMMQLVQHKDLAKAGLRLLGHSWKDIGWKYEGLTEKEKELITREQFEKLVPIVKDLMK